MIATIGSVVEGHMHARAKVVKQGGNLGVEGPMVDFDTKQLPARRDTIAPDGSEVRILLELAHGGMAHFALGPGLTSKAIVHRTVGEIWFFLSGQGEMWRRQNGRTSIVTVCAGTCVTIPLGTHFQFRSLGSETLTAIGVTMPPWPGEAEAVIVEGEWLPSQAPPS